jgi:phosphoribosylanthranilate isomerase
VLLDGPAPRYGGGGVPPDWDLCETVARRRPVLLGGGLTADNVAEAIRRVQPFAVDVASGVEAAPGVKDADRMRAFCAAARGA